VKLFFKKTDIKTLREIWIKQIAITTKFIWFSNGLSEGQASREFLWSSYTCMGKHQETIYSP